MPEHKPFRSDRFRDFVFKRKPLLWLGAGASCQAEPPIPTLWGLVMALQQRYGWDPGSLGDDPYAYIDAFLDEEGTRGDLEQVLEECLRPEGRCPS